ncbi:MAG: bacterial Ig-like domain-containing protein [Eubacteriales bacterium]|nr:bacterial Ig-like domain-containing protein [Christensenellaceae bacterium]MEA5067171.1 bacterial Ig-like domain-containing protein [Eubacteriales bacterium]
MADGFKFGGGGVRPPKLTGLTIHRPPTKTQYDDGETFDRTGMEVHAVYDDGHFLDVTAVASYEPDRPLTVGDTSITISYADGGVIKMTTQSITVRYLTGIRITTPPTKTDYRKDDTFDPAGMVVTADYSVGSSAPVTGYTFSPSGQLDVTDAEVTISYTWGSQTKTATTPITVVELRVFGVMWNYANSSPELARLTPGNDPNGLVNQTIATEPTAAIGTTGGSSPFDAFSPWKDMVKYNADAAGDVSAWTSNSNDTVVRIPAFWFKIVEDTANSKMYFYVSDAPVTGMTLHPGSNRYVARYTCGSGYVSKTGFAPLVSIMRAPARTGCASKGTGTKWWQFDYALLNAIWLLYLVEWASWNSQAKIGRGYVDGNSAAINTGGTDAMTYHTGRAAGTDGKTAVQYRWIENLWGNVNQWVDGINFYDRYAYICTDPVKFTDDTGADYTQAAMLPSSGWINKMSVSNISWALQPRLASGGSDTTFITDYVYSNTGWRVLYVGGDWSSGSFVGLFCFSAGVSSTSEGAGIGARLQIIPEEGAA